MYVINVEIVVDPKDAETLRQLARVHAANSRKEPGCRAFQVAEDNDKPGVFRIWEVYDDEAAFEFHTKQPSIAEFREKSAKITKSRDLKKLTMVTG